MIVYNENTGIIVIGLEWIGTATASIPIGGVLGDYFLSVRRQRDIECEILNRDCCDYSGG